MNLFAVHMDGFEPETWPVVSFSRKGVCERLLNDFQSGDRILYVGIIEANIRHESRKLLGLVEINDDQIVNTEEFIDLSTVNCRSYKKNCTFKWPYGIRVSRAWRFTPKDSLPDARSHIGDRYSSPPRGNYYPVDDDKIDAIMNLRQTEVTEFYNPPKNTAYADH